MNLQWDHMKGLLIAVTIKKVRGVDLPRSSWQIPFWRVYFAGSKQTANADNRVLSFFLMLFLQNNSKIIDTTKGNLSVGQFLGVHIDSVRE